MLLADNFTLEISSQGGIFLEFVECKNTWNVGLWLLKCSHVLAKELKSNNV